MDKCSEKSWKAKSHDKMKKWVAVNFSCCWLVKFSSFTYYLFKSSRFLVSHYLVSLEILLLSHLEKQKKIFIFGITIAIKVRLFEGLWPLQSSKFVLLYILGKFTSSPIIVIFAPNTQFFTRIHMGYLKFHNSDAGSQYQCF